MVQLLITLVLFAIGGFVIGVGVQLTRDFPKLGEFIKNRPILGWAAAGFLFGAASSLIIYLLEIAALGIIDLVLKGR